MSAAATFTMSRVASATTPASRKFHGTMASARRSRRSWPTERRADERSTSETIERTLVSEATVRTRTYACPSSTIVPAKTSSPAARSTASGSPVRAAWLTITTPRSTTPSMGTGAAFLSTMRSPGLSSETGTESSSSPSATCAVSDTASSE